MVFIIPTLLFLLIILITGSLIRYDLTLDESTESSLQATLQLATYLTIQLWVASTGVPEDDNFKFQAILLSGLSSTLSLTMAQVKVRRIITSYLNIFTNSYFMLKPLNDDYRGTNLPLSIFCLSHNRSVTMQ